MYEAYEKKKYFVNAKQSFVTSMSVIKLRRNNKTRKKNANT